MVSAILSKGNSGTQGGARPSAAVELTQEGVLAGALAGKNQAPVCAFKTLPAGALLPGIGEPNVRAPETIAEAIRSALDAVSPRTHSVSVVIPDTAVRVFVLDFDTLPARAAEAFAVLRFRMRKMVPFDVEHAGISYQILSENKNECRVLVAILPSAILAEYETAVREAGYEPGAVVPSGLAALAALDSAEPVLAACLSHSALTTSITNGNDLLLYRTLDLPDEPKERIAELQRGVAVAAAYYEDKLAGRPRKLYFAGNGDAAEFTRWIGDPEFSVVELAPRSVTGTAGSMGSVSFAGISGALAGAA